MTPPRSAFGASPSRGRHQRPGKAGSAVALEGIAVHDGHTLVQTFFRSFSPNSPFGITTSMTSTTM